MSEILWTRAETEAATGGRAQGAWETLAGVAIDSRAVVSGDLFVALPGSVTDGHAHVASALAAGATAALAARVPECVAADAPLLLVRDTQAALEDLGRAARHRGDARILAVTGSVGKTTTKEMLRHVLARQGATHAADKSFNNHVGVPLTLARLPARARFAVFELGMNHAGEIARLTAQVRPEVAIITTVEAVHLAHFESVEGIADAKAEIFLGMDHRGVAILNRDNAHYARLVAAARTQGVREILCFGREHRADAHILSAEADAGGSRVVAEFLGETVEFQLSLPGRHFQTVALAVLLAVRAAGGDLRRAAEDLASFAPVAGRGTRLALTLPGGRRITLIDESYNASPVAVAAALDTLSLTQPAPGGHRVAVLGDMLELGPEGPALHAALADAAQRADVRPLHACGPLMRELWERMPPLRRGLWAEDSAGLAPQLAAALRDGDVVLVKGSLGSRMRLVVEALRAAATEIGEAG